MVVERGLDKRSASSESEEELIVTYVRMIVLFVMNKFSVPDHVVDWATGRGEYADLAVIESPPSSSRTNDVDTLECGKCGATQNGRGFSAPPLSTCKACRMRHRKWAQVGFHADVELRGKVTKKCGYCGWERRFLIGRLQKQRCSNADCPVKQHARWHEPDSVGAFVAKACGHCGTERRLRASQRKHRCLNAMCDKKHHRNWRTIGVVGDNGGGGGGGSASHHSSKPVLALAASVAERRPRNRKELPKKKRRAGASSDNSGDDSGDDSRDGFPHSKELSKKKKRRIGASSNDSGGDSGDVTEPKTGPGDGPRNLSRP
jgi:hypothetical protein